MKNNISTNDSEESQYNEDEIKELALKIVELTDGNICNHCLGRKFSNIIEGPGNELRGEKIRNLIGSKYSQDNNLACSVCDDIFEKIKSQIINITNLKVNKLDLEYNDFLVGSKVPDEIIARDEKLSEDLSLDVESIKKEINREIGKLLSSTLNKEVNFDDPNIVMMFKLKEDEFKVRIQINPLFIYGRYKKLKRGIPQTKWPCRECKGKGCSRCNFTGQMYEETVEGLISELFLEKTKGYSTKFHGAGREDIDVRMLGSGRPFVLEIKEPKKRNLNLSEMEKAVNESSINKAEFIGLEFTKRSKKAEIKTSSPDTYKVYCAIVECENPIIESDLDKLNTLNLIKQRTPVRVSHRRADKIREREVKELETELIDETHFKMKVKTEGGLYIKELISGDYEISEDNEKVYRSNPNVSEILNNQCICKTLDVIEVGY